MSIELKARLTELGHLLGREVAVTGSRKDLEARVKELEEELATMSEETTDGDAGDQTGGDDGDQTDEDAGDQTEGDAGDQIGGDAGDQAGGDAGDQAGGYAAEGAAGLVCVTMRATVDIPCLDANGVRPAYALAGERVSVSARVAQALKQAGLAT